VPEPLLSAAMIVRDEASRLPECLQSIREVVDEIVIVDTGSTDETVSIARSFGARVLVHRWDGDFAAARNAGLEMATGRWILYIDADERLRPIEPELVRSTVMQATEVALRVRLKPFAGATPYWEYRLWRSHPRIRFEGVMHEKVTPSIGVLVAEERMTVGESPLFIDHIGYDGDQTHKHERNLPLLRAQLSADPTSPYNWSHLGEVLAGLGELEPSEEAFERAVQVAREHRESPGALAFVELIRMRLDRGHDVTELLDEALSRYPDNIALAWQKACDEIERGNHEQALRWLERFNVEFDTEMPIEDTVAYPADLFGLRVAKARGLCLFKLGRCEEAAASYRRAEQFAPEDQSLRLMRTLAERRALEEATDAGSETAADESPTGAHLWAPREVLGGLVLDLAGVPVELRATDATRAAAIRLLLGRMAPSGLDPVAHLEFGSHRVPPPDRPADEELGGFELWHDDEVLSLTYGLTVGGRVESGQARLGGYSPDLNRLFHHAAPFMLASLLGPHGRFVLHAGAIHRDGEAVLILGGSGSGKSTLVFGALDQGWKALSDDLVVVRRQPSGPVISGIPKGLVVPHEVIGEGRTSWSLRPDARNRVQIPFDDWDRGSYPVTAVVVVEHGEGERAENAPIESSQLLAMLLNGMFCRQPSIVRDYVQLAIALCSRPACRLLHSGSAEDRAPRAAEAVAAHLRGATEAAGGCSSARARPTS
jgi:tetratricopeptide (TPR) repeat protein